MHLPRSSLPPLSALAALEALERLGSAAAVAQELALSPSAVSRQLQKIEACSDTPLFRREGRGITLTDTGQRYARQVRGGLHQIADATLALRLPQQGGALNLAMLPSFGMRWLVPRLPEFARRHPAITLNISTRLKPFDLDAEGVDAAILFGQPQDWDTLDSLLLSTEDVTPVCAPRLRGPAPLSLSALGALPLLQIETRPRAWADWFAAQGSDLRPRAGPRFDQFTTIIQAARHGLGVALPPRYLVAEELAAGHLVEATQTQPISLGAYYLVWSKRRSASPPLRALRDWLAQHGEGEDALPR